MKTSAAQQPLALLPVSAEDEGRATELADRLGCLRLPLGTDPVNCAQVAALLVVSGESLRLQQTGKGAPGPVAVDFDSASLRHRRRAGGPELLGKAVGHGRKRSLRILDGTAGLGRDAFVLAGLGDAVILCEREPVLVEMLAAGLRCARGVGLVDVVSRMTLCPGDAREVSGDLLSGVDVIYLDPMFPARGKSAAVKKEMALMQRLLQRADWEQDADSLLHWAREQDVARVVVKRPARALYLADMEPGHSVKGKAVRYDVYVNRKLS